MRKLILSWTFFIIIMFLLLVMFGLEATASKIINDRREPQEIVVATIQVLGGTFYDKNTGVQLRGEFEGEVFFSDDSEVVLSYIKNPGPMRGTRYASGLIVLKPRTKE